MAICGPCGQYIAKHDDVWMHPPGTLGCADWQRTCPGMYGAPVATPDGKGEWGVEIQESKRTVVEGPFSEAIARHEFDRWKGYGYNTTAVMYRPDPDAQWERVE